MSDATPILVPMENVNDETVRLVNWLVAEGADVREGEAIAEVETSKAVIELVAPGAGKIAFAAELGEEVAVGAVIGYLSNSETSAIAAARTDKEANRGLARAEASPKNHPAASVPGVRFSKKALQLIDQHSLSADLFSAHAMVREADVQALLDKLQEPERDNLHFALLGISLDGVTLPAVLSPTDEGKLDPQFLNYLRESRESFGKLSSAEKCDEYREHGAIIGADVVLGRGTVIVAPQIIVEDGVSIGDQGSIDCSECFVAGRLSSFRAGLSVEAATVVLGENIFGCNRVEISGGASSPWAVLYVGDTTFIGDDVILDITRPIVIGKEAFVTQRAIVITHNIGHSILDGYENRFEPVVLEDRSQVGMNSTIYAGSRVGSGAIVASNSYVVSSIPAGKLAIGVPAKVAHDAARPPSRKQQVRIAKQMVEDFRELLKLKGHDVSPVSADRFSLEYDGKLLELIFVEDYSDNADLGSSDATVIWTLENASVAQRARCTVVDLVTKKIEGEGGIFADSAREFLRKRGIRCQPGPWRYRGGMI